MSREKNQPQQPQIEDALVPITLRIPKYVHARLKEMSQREYRSLNHQVIMALSYFVQEHEKNGGPPAMTAGLHLNEDGEPSKRRPGKR